VVDRVVVAVVEVGRGHVGMVGEASRLRVSARGVWWRRRMVEWVVLVVGIVGVVGISDAFVLVAFYIGVAV